MDAQGASITARTTTQARTSIKLKLRFSEPQSILSRRQLQEGLEQCWILLPSSCTSVGHIAAFITRSFDLSSTCPNGISLAMEGFTLPVSQSAALLQDSDLVHVRPLPGEVERTHRSLINHQHHLDGTLDDEPTANGLGYALDGPQVKGHGQFQSSGFREDLLEPDALRIDWVHGDVAADGEKSLQVLQDLQKGGRLLESAPVEKRISEQDEQPGRRSANQQPTLENDLCIPTKVKGRKKKKRRLDATLEEEDFVVAKDLAEEDGDVMVSQELVEEQPSSVRDKVVPRSKKQRQSSRRGESAELEEESVAEIPKQSAKKPKKGQDVPCVSLHHEIISCQTDKKIGKKSGELARKLVDARDRSRGTETEKVKLYEAQGEANRPSRSARRKKAKRCWLRGQAEAQKQSCQTLNGVGDQSTDEGEESEESEDEEEGEKWVSQSVPLSVIEDVDDRQDSVPVVVRPGHIRFEPLEDQDGVARQNLPDLKLGMAIMSKKQGQLWGQAKDAYKNENKWTNPRNGPIRGGVRCDEPTTVAAAPATAAPVTLTNLESLPALAGNPREGDVLAYRLVELSATWTPALSLDRVGKVVTYDATSKGILLKPVDEYPLKDTFLSGPEQYVHPPPEPEDFAFPTPYGSDGSLEIGYTELVDVRLVQKAGCAGSVSNQQNGKGKKPNGSAFFPKDMVIEDSSKGGDVDKSAAANDSIKTETYTILKLKAQPVRHRSVRALRAAALGPALALLRAQHEL